MEAVLFGVSKHPTTNKATLMLSDARTEFRFVDLKSPTSSKSVALSAMINSNKLPVLADKGVVYIGIESIQRYCRS